MFQKQKVDLSEASSEQSPTDERQNKRKQNESSDNNTSQSEDTPNMKVKDEKNAKNRKISESETTILEEGFILKKSSRQFMGIAKWQKRYALLEG